MATGEPNWKVCIQSTWFKELCSEDANCSGSLVLKKRLAVFFLFFFPFFLFYFFLS